MFFFLMILSGLYLAQPIENLMVKSKIVKSIILIGCIIIGINIFGIYCSLGGGGLIGSTMGGAEILLINLPFLIFGYKIIRYGIRKLP